MLSSSSNSWGVKYLKCRPWEWVKSGDAREIGSSGRGGRGLIGWRKFRRKCNSSQFSTLCCVSVYCNAECWWRKIIGACVTREGGSSDNVGTTCCLCGPTNQPTNLEGWKRGLPSCLWLGVAAPLDHSHSPSWPALTLKSLHSLEIDNRAGAVFLFWCSLKF